MLKQTDSEILYNINSETPSLVINAIIKGVQEKNKDPFFIEALKNNKANKESVLNVPISYMAIAALDVLGVEKYSGQEELICEIIESQFAFW